MLWDSSCSPARRSKQPKPRGQLLQSLSGARSQDCRCLACSILVNRPGHGGAWWPWVLVWALMLASYVFLGKCLNLLSPSFCNCKAVPTSWGCWEKLTNKHR